MASSKRRQWPKPRESCHHRLPGIKWLELVGTECPMLYSGGDMDADVFPHVQF